MKDSPIALPTRKVAGSPTRVSMPAALLTMAVMISGPTKSTLSVLQTPMMTGATRMTAVALGSRAQTGATSATMSSRSRLPLPPVARRNGVPEPVEDPGLGDHPRHHHAAEEQGERTASGVHDRHQIAAVEDTERDQEADPEQGGDRHVDQIEGDQEDHGGEDADGEIDLKVGHRGVTQSIDGT